MEDMTHGCFVGSDAGTGFRLLPMLYSGAQLIHVLRGEVVFRFGVHCLRAAADDIFYLPSGTVMSAESEGYAVVHRAVFDIAAVGEEADGFDSELLSIHNMRYKHSAVAFMRDHPLHGYLVGALQKLFDEWQTKDVCYRLSIKATVFELLANILRSFAAEQYLDDRTAYKNMQRLRPVIRYVDEHYAEKIYIRDLSALTDVSEDHFEKLFRTAMGRTPLEYVGYIRLCRAMELLIHTRDSVTKVARAAGFSGSTFFTRRFTEVVGMSPQEYRRTVDPKTEDKMEEI